MKRKDEVLLGLLWAALYLPYVMQGGWVQDDLALLSSTRLAHSYLQWQWFVSSNRDIAGRPVSGILHGLCYWLLGRNAWGFHLVNLALFGASVLLFYWTIRKLISRDVALVSAVLALVYPSASTVLFSSIMMNSNLAAFFWCGGLYVWAGNSRHKVLLTTALFAMSTLSYEAFIPLLAFGVLVDILVLKLHQSDRWRLLADALPVFGAVTIFAAYRGVLEKLVFHTSFTRLVIADLPVLLEKFVSNIVSGLRIVAWDSLVLSTRGFSNFGRVPLISLVALAPIVVLVAVQLGRSTMPAECQASREVDARNSAVYLGLAACLFASAHLIFVLSNYTPSSLAFENRTLEGVQLCAALAIALLANFMCRGPVSPHLRGIVPLFLIAVFSLFTVGIVRHRQAWILAGHHNEQMADQITDAIRRQNVTPGETFKMVALLPTEFPGQINDEPTLRVFWDITPMLELRNPDLVITANVYGPTALATASKVSIEKYGLSWEVTYPFWLYSYADHEMYWVESQQDWNRYIQLTSMATAIR